MKSMKSRAVFAKSTCAAALVFGTLAASPALAEWRGSAVVRTHTAPCVTGGTYTTGAIVNARYRLPNLLGNGPDTRLTFYDRYYGFAVKRVGALSGAFLPATGTGFGSGGAFIWSKPTLVRVVSRVPAAVVATTPFVNMQIQITNFDEILGCTVTIDLSLFKR
jgi:hypothetical protein